MKQTINNNLKLKNKNINDRLNDIFDRIEHILDMIDIIVSDKASEVYKKDKVWC